MRDLIQTNRLKLRKLTMDDAPIMAKLMNDPDILRMTTSLAPILFTLSADFWVMRQLSQWQRGLGNAYAITRQGDQLMGIMDLFSNHNKNREIGYWIGKPFWGHGFITEAAEALIAESFSSLPIPYIEAGYFSDNPSSGHILNKLGFVPENNNDNVLSIARGKRAAGIKLRLHRKTAMNRLETNASR